MRARRRGGPGARVVAEFWRRSGRERPLPINSGYAHPASGTPSPGRSVSASAASGASSGP